MIASLLLAASLMTLDELPWIGDSRPERTDASWYEDDPAPIFSAQFVMPRGFTVKRVAKMLIASPGCYAVTVNGQQANGMVTASHPLWSPFDKTIYVEDFSIGRMLLPYPATNQVSIILGNGWYNMPPLKFWGSICFREHLAHGRPCFKLAIDGVDDLKWMCRESDLVQNSYHLGEVYDLRREPDRNPKPAFEVRGPRGRLVLRTAPQIGQVGLQGEFGTARWLKKGESQVVDFGTNLSALYFLALRTKGLASGDRVEMIYGERLNADGSVTPLTQTAGQIKSGNGGEGAPQVAMQRDAVILGERTVADGGWMFGNAFSWHVARYVEVRGLRELLGPRDAQRIVFGSQLQRKKPGRSFKSKNADFTALHEMCVRTFQANAVGVQSDCPGRERLQYGGDIVATCEAMALNFDMKEFYLKTLQDFADEAAGDGWIPETSPFVGIANATGIATNEKNRRGPISWALVVPTLMDLVIRHYPDADKRALAFYPVCTRYVGLMEAAYPTGIVPHCIGDHEALERAPDEVTATAHWHEFVRLTAKFAKMLGKKEDAERYGALADKIAKAFAEKHVNGGIVANGTQSAQAIALYLGLVPAAQVDAAEARLVKAIEEKGFAPSTGIFSTRYMLMYLSEHGKRDVAEKIVLHRGFPGWLNMLACGASTLWETWKESDDTYSNCHPMFGSVDEWILKYANAK